MAIPEYMKVRQYLYNIILKSGSKSEKIPSESMLRKKFGVSRVTVRAAIKGLVDDNFLISRQGVGTFTNPEMNSGILNNSKVIGVWVGNGKQVTLNTVNTGILNAIKKSGMVPELIFSPESNSPTQMVDILKNNVNGVIWQAPNLSIEYMNRIFAAGIPLLTIDNSELLPDYIDQAYYSNSSRGKILAKYLYERGHSKIVFIHNRDRNRFIESPTLTVCRQRLEKLCNEAKVDCISILELDELLEKDKEGLFEYSLIYTLSEDVPAITNSLSSGQISIPEDISFLTYGHTDKFFFGGKEPSYIDDTNSVCSHIVEWLDLRISKENTEEHFCRKLTSNIFDGKTIMKLNNPVRTLHAT